MQKIGVGIRRFLSFVAVRKVRVIGILGVLVIGLLIATIATPFKESTTSTISYGEAPPTTKTSVTYFRAKVLEVTENSLTVRLSEGPRTGFEEQVPWAGDITEMKSITQGSTIIVSEYDNDPGVLSLVDNFRIPILVIMATLFVILVLAVGGRRGGTSLIGLGVGILVLGWFIVPLVLSGHDAFWICVAGAYIIAFTSILIAHGWRRRTLISLLCIAAVLATVCLLSYLAVTLASLTGLVDETAFYLKQGSPHINLGGVIAGGIIIATLGVLDDIVTAQVAVVEELKKAKPSMTIRGLYAAGSSVGKEHIASLVNTLALAYAGASLPLILYLAGSGIDSGVMLFNGEYLASEIVRTLVASSGLVLAVPVSTLTAAYIYHRLIK